MKQNKKYKFDLKDTIEIEGHKLYRIIALRPFSNVEEGDKGGYIESEDNLSHQYDCWVYDNAMVYDEARVFDYAKVCGKARICGNANVYDDAWIFGNADVYGNANIHGNAEVFGNANIHGNAEVFGNAEIFGNAWVYDNAAIYGNCWVFGDTKICGNANVYDDARVYGDAKVCGDAKIKSNRDYIVFKNFWSSGRYFTWTRSNNKWTIGCFNGTAEELILKAYNESQEKGREYERVVRYVESILADEEHDKEL